MQSPKKEYTVQVEEQGARRRLPQAVGAGAKKGAQAVGGVFSSFRSFIDKGNVIDMAVGIVLGAAFTAIVTSFVKDIINPVIGLAFKANFENAFVAIGGAIQNCRDPALAATKCTTPLVAQENGVITLTYGSFFNTVINFLLTSIILFFIVKAYALSFRRKKAITSKKCQFCCKDIPLGAIRCPECTSLLEEKDK